MHLQIWEGCVGLGNGCTMDGVWLGFAFRLQHCVYNTLGYTISSLDGWLGGFGWIERVSAWRCAWSMIVQSIA